MLADTTGSQATNTFTGRVPIECINLTTIDHLCQVIVTHVGRTTDEDAIQTISDHNDKYGNEYLVKKQSVNKLVPQLLLKCWWRQRSTF